MRTLLSLMISIALLSACSKDKSAENVLNSIRILSEIGAFAPASSSNMTNSELRYLSQSYCRASEIGAKYSPRTLRKKLGKDFEREWTANLPAIDTQCATFKAIENMKPGYRLSDEAIIDQVKAIQQLKRFRIFYQRWRSQ